MQGIHVINDLNGKPAVLTIDLNHLDPDVSPFVEGLLTRVGIKIENRIDGAEERREFMYTSGILANRAYGDEEPEYTDEHLIERNPNYRPNPQTMHPD